MGECVVCSNGMRKLDQEVKDKIGMSTHLASAKEGSEGKSSAGKTCTLVLPLLDVFFPSLGLFPSILDGNILATVDFKNGADILGLVNANGCGISQSQ